MRTKLDRLLRILTDSYVRQVKPAEGNKKSGDWEKAKTIANWFAAILIPLVLGVSGYFVNLSIDERVGRTKLIEIATAILNSEPSKNDQNKLLRGWAVDIIKKNSPVPFPEELKVILQDNSLPTSNSTLNFQIGIVNSRMSSQRAELRRGEAAFGNLVADALLEAFSEGPEAQADLALISAGSIRGDREYPPGHRLTRQDLLTEIPFGNTAQLLAVRGGDLLSVLQRAIDEPGRSRFPQVSGVSIVYDSQKQKGDRIVEVSIRGSKLDVSKNYNVVTIDYNADGGDDYSDLKMAARMRHSSVGRHLADIVLIYIASRRSVTPSLQGRIADMSAKP